MFLICAFYFVCGVGGGGEGGLRACEVCTVQLKINGLVKFKDKSPYRQG